MPPASIVDAQSDLQRYLPVRDLIVFDVTARFDDLEPVQIAQCFAGFSIAQRIASSLDFVDEPVSSICLYTWSLMIYLLMVQKV